MAFVSISLAEKINRVNLLLGPGLSYTKCSSMRRKKKSQTVMFQSLTAKAQGCVERA